MATFQLFLPKFIENLEKLKSLSILDYSRKINTMFKKTIVYEGLQYGGKQMCLQYGGKQMCLQHFWFGTRNLMTSQP